MCVCCGSLLWRNGCPVFLPIRIALLASSGHKVKSLTNPDMRVVIMKEFVKENFPKTPLLDYALEVEKITTAKKSNLILNVDGVIAVAFVDLLRECVCCCCINLIFGGDGVGVT